MVPRVEGSSPFCHPILKKSADLKSIKTTFPRFFCVHFAPPQARIYKAFAPYSTKLPILKLESNSQKSPAFKTHKSRKIRKILEKSQKNLTSGNSSCLKCKPQTVYPQIPNFGFSDFGEEQFRLLGRRQLHKIHNLGNPETRNSRNSGNMRIVLDFPFGKPTVENDGKRHKLCLSGRSGPFRQGVRSFASDDFVPPVPSRFNVYFAPDFHFSPFQCPFRFPCKKPIFRPFRRNRLCYWFFVTVPRTEWQENWRP